ncbi:MAG: hypothetical protein IIB66_07945 [Proteobacteria bacterium]|nr:hypothetical protein [Pseudomonadota bacterium]
MTREPDDEVKSRSFPLGWLAVAGVGVCCALPFLIGAVAAGSTFVVFSWFGLSSLLALGALALFISYALLRRWKGRRIAPASTSRTHGFPGNGASDGKH